jgi:hypothetical protein
MPDPIGPWTKTQDENYSKKKWPCRLTNHFLLFCECFPLKLAGISAEYLLNNGLQMRTFDANKKARNVTKQMKIGLCEQVRVNWKTALSLHHKKG